MQITNDSLYVKYHFDKAVCVIHTADQTPGTAATEAWFDVIRWLREDTQIIECSFVNLGWGKSP